MKLSRRMLVLGILSAALVAAGPAAPASAQPISADVLRNGPKVLQAFHDVVAKPSESTVRVLCDGKEAALGTITDADGWILTKASELKGKISCKLKDGTECEARLVGVIPDYDLAMLKVEAKNLPAIEWRNSKEAHVGKWVASVGLGNDPVAIGVISVATRKYQPGDQPPKTTNANAGWLGVGLEESSKGAKISNIMPKSPAQKAGLKVNDIVIEAGGRKIIDNESLINTIQRHKPGDSITLKITRAEEELELKATLEKLPKQMLGNPQETMGGKLSNRRGGFPFILQHDTVLKPVDCGGPLVDLDGKAVGVNISRAGRTETYALPSEKVQELLGKLKSGELAPKEETKEEAKGGTQEPAPKKNPDQILRAVFTLNAKDKLTKGRPGSYMKVHELKLVAGTTYIIEMDSTDFDAYLILEDAGGKKLAEDDDSGGDLNARITFRAPTDGTYRIIATSFDANSTGNYTLTVRKKADAQEDKE